MKIELQWLFGLIDIALIKVAIIMMVIKVITMEGFLILIVIVMYNYNFV